MQSNTEVRNEQSSAIILDQKWKIYQWILTKQDNKVHKRP